MWLDSYFHSELIIEISQAKGFRGSKHGCTFEPLGFIGAVGHEWQTALLLKIAQSEGYRHRR
jgi:hypothetical protein